MAANETWIARCPQCGEGALTLAPADQRTKHCAPYVEVYCSHCQWRDKLYVNLKKIYVRI